VTPRARRVGFASLAGCGAIAAIAACHDDVPTGPLEQVAIAEPAAHWAGGGFAEMVPAIRPPTSLAGDDRITVWLRIPDGATLGVRRLADGRAVVRYPPGAVADRVELREPVAWPDDQHAWRVIDVRGTQLDRGEAGDGAEQFHCLIPGGHSGALTGFAWPRGDAGAERAATEGLVALARAADAAGDAAASTDLPDLARLRRLAHCEACHDHDRPEHTGLAGAGPRRATDAAGFYAILAVLADTAPLETHRPRDPNGDDPFVTVARLGGGVPRATLDLRRALAAGAPHALAVCRSRRYLFDHMDAEARRAFAQAFSECDIR
jgi:hypothetical protein